MRHRRCPHLLPCPPTLHTVAWRLAAGLDLQKSIPHTGCTSMHRDAEQASWPVLARTVHWEVRTTGEVSC